MRGLSWQRWARFTVSVLVVLVACAPPGPRRDQVVKVTIDENCGVTPDYVLIWSQQPPPGEATRVEWEFAIPPSWYGKVTAAPASAQDRTDTGYGHTKRKLLEPEYTTEKSKTIDSGRPKKLKPKIKNNLDPVWYYSVAVWSDTDDDGEPEGQPKCGSDPGVCIRGGGGNACEAYRTVP